MINTTIFYLFVERIMTPRRVLEHFAKMTGFRIVVFGNSDPKTAEDLWLAGIGVGVIAWEAILALGSEFKPARRGLPIDDKGHVDVIDGKKFMVELSWAAVALSFDEVFRQSR